MRCCIGRIDPSHCKFALHFEHNSPSSAPAYGTEFRRPRIHPAYTSNHRPASLSDPRHYAFCRFRHTRYENNRPSFVLQRVCPRARSRVDKRQRHKPALGMHSFHQDTSVRSRNQFHHPCLPLRSIALDLQNRPTQDRRRTCQSPKSHYTQAETRTQRAPRETIAQTSVS